MVDGRQGQTVVQECSTRSRGSQWAVALGMMTRIMMMTADNITQHR